MPWRPALGTQPLAPFDHQVAGQSSMLRYDKTTVCKPLIAREHFVYKTLPQELAEFTPEYRGEIEVQLIEEDGYIQLYGLCVHDEDSDDECPCTSVSENHGHQPLDVRPKVISKEASLKNRSTVRLLRSGSYEVCSSTDEVFYASDSNPDHPHTHSLNPWSLKNHKRLLDKMRKSELSDNTVRFILLKNVVADFRHPCILDLKIGSRLHGDNASSVKVASQSEKCRRTTSSTLGIRLCGMQVYQVDSSAYHSVDKYHGRTLNSDSFRDMLYDFLHNGTRFRSELIQPIVSRLSELIQCLEKQHSFRFYASSLLIIYDGDTSLTAGNQETKGNVNFIGGNQEMKVNVNSISGNQETKVNVNSIAGNQETKGNVNFIGGNQETKVNVNSIAGNQETKGNVSFFAGNQEVKLLTLVSNVTADVKPVELTTEHHHSSKECCQSVKKQPDEICGDINCLSCSASASFQSLSCRESEQPKVSEKNVSEVHTKSLTTANEKEDSCSMPSTIHFNIDASNQTDLVKNVVLDSEKHILNSAQSSKTGDTSVLPKNHIVNQEQDYTGLSTLDVEKNSASPDDVSQQDSQHPVSQTVLLDKQHQCIPQTDSFTVTQPSNVSNVNSTQTDSLLDNCKHSLILNRAHELLSDTGCSSTRDENLCLIHKPLDDSCVNSELHEKTSVSKGRLQDMSLVNSGIYEKTSITQSRHSVDYPVVTVPSHNAESQNISPQTNRTSFQEHPVTSPSPKSSDSCKSSVKVNVKMIDFAHTTHKGFTADKIKHSGPDTDYIQGLQNLMTLFQELQGRE